MIVSVFNWYSHHVHNASRKCLMEFSKKKKNALVVSFNFDDLQFYWYLNIRKMEYNTRNQ